MTRVKRVLLAGVAAVIVAAPLWADANRVWQHMGTSGFTVPPSGLTGWWNTDWKRIKFNGIAIDRQGNVYATATVGNNNGNAGGLSIFTPGGLRVDVDLNGLGFPGGITKMVTGGDGKVYALQNWLEISWSYNSGVPNRIIRIDFDGVNASVTQIWSPGAASDANRIGGLAAGGDGNIYWVTNGSDGYWKYHYFARYNVSSGMVEWPARDGTVNEGWSQNQRMFVLEYVGRYQDETTLTDWFSVIGGSGSASWGADAIFWGPAGTNDGHRRQGNIGAANPGWGRDHVTAMAWDPAHKKLWVGGRGTQAATVWAFNGGGANTFVDLGGGNMGLRMKNNSGSLDQYLRTHTAGATEVTYAVRFTVDAYDAGFKGTLAYSHLDTGSGSPIPGICIINDRFWLVNCFDSGSEVMLKDLGPVGALPTAPIEVQVYYNNTENRVTCWWNGTEVYNMAGLAFGKPGQARFGFGALCQRPYNWPKNLTCTVTFDHVWYDEGPSVAPPRTWRTQSIPEGGLLACSLDMSNFPDAFVQTNIMTRWDADPDTFNPTNALFEKPVVPPPFPPDEYEQMGIGRNVSWHTNRNDPSQSNIPNGGRYWVSAITIDPTNGAAWMGWGVNEKRTDGGYYTYSGGVGAVGTVWAVHRDFGIPQAEWNPEDPPTEPWSEGVPQQFHSAEAKRGDRTHIVALAASSQAMYALNFDTVTGEYNLFRSWTGICNSPPQDTNGDGDVDLQDFAAFASCFSGPNSPWAGSLPDSVCGCLDVDRDRDVDLGDFSAFNGCFNGPNRPAACLP